MPIPSAREKRTLDHNKKYNEVYKFLEETIEKWDSTVHNQTSLKFIKESEAKMAVEILGSLDYIYNKRCVNECNHTCEKCGYDSDTDNFECVHYRGECNCPTWWIVVISLPDSDSD